MHVLGHIRAAWTAGHMLRLPSQHLFEEWPHILQGGYSRIIADGLGNNPSISLGLSRRCETELLEQNRRHDKADWLNVVQPFKVGIALRVSRHPISSRRRPKIHQAHWFQPMRVHLVRRTDA